MTEQAKPAATLTLGDKSIELPVLSGSTGPDVIDIRKLYAGTGAFTFDPGFTSTASCESGLTFIDGDEGVLLHRGYPIDQLASQSNFLEVCHLLLKGELPTASEYEAFKETVTKHTMLHAQFDRFFEGFRRDAHPMAIMVGTVGALSAFYHDSLDINDPVQREISAIRLIAKMPTIAARAYKYHVGQPFISPRNDLSYAENFLRMCFAVPAEDYSVDPRIVRAMDRIFTLHADHEQNASTSTVRLAGSSGANPFACIAAGIACLWGPSHGGANEEALNMLKEIGTPDRIPEFIQGVKDRKYKLMGFGHRVYKKGDSRVPTMKAALDTLVEYADAADLAALYDALERDFVGRKGIYPNLDYPSGPAYRIMGFDTLTFTPLFVASRVTGWTAHIMEQAASNALIRPLSAYNGVDERHIDGYVASDAEIEVAERPVEQAG